MSSSEVLLNIWNKIKIKLIFFFQLEIEGAASTFLYFGYTSIMVFTFFLLTGTNQMIFNPKILKRMKVSFSLLSHEMKSIIVVSMFIVIKLRVNFKSLFCTGGESCPKFFLVPSDGSEVRAQLKNCFFSKFQKNRPRKEARGWKSRFRGQLS